MNLNKIDRIILEGEQIYMLDNWWINIHQGDSNYLPCVLEEGLIILRLKSAEHLGKKVTSKELHLYFKQLNEDEVYYELYRVSLDNEFSKILKATTNYTDLNSTVEIIPPNIFGLTNKDCIRFLDSVISPHIALMNYMALYRDVRERISSQKIAVFPQGKNKHKKDNKKRKNVRPITIVEYKLSFPTEHVSEQEKKEYNRNKEAWKVRGHWRKLKNGKETWIKTYVKGDTEKIEPTTYIG